MFDYCAMDGDPDAGVSCNMASPCQPPSDWPLELPPMAPKMHCESHGDPHITTFAHHRYDIMGVGVFPFAELTGFKAQTFHCPATKGWLGASTQVGVAIQVSKRCPEIQCCWTKQPNLCQAAVLCPILHQSVPAHPRTLCNVDEVARVAFSFVPKEP